MGTVIPFPCKTRVAANDSNPWVSDEPLPEPGKAEPVYAQPCKVFDQASGVTYNGYAIPEEKKPGAGKFILAVIAWLVLLGIVV